MKVGEVGCTTPLLHYDLHSSLLVFQRRSPGTGEVTFQVPTNEAIQQAREAHQMHPSAVGLAEALDAARSALEPVGAERPATDLPVVGPARATHETGEVPVVPSQRLSVLA